jgi:hypothetical protein
MTVAKEYKVDIVGVQKVRWDRGGTKPGGEYTFFYGKGNEGFFVLKRVEFVSDRMSYLTFIVLQGQSSGPHGKREECYVANLVAQSRPVPH